MKGAVQGKGQIPIPCGGRDELAGLLRSQELLSSFRGLLRGLDLAGGIGIDLKPLLEPAEPGLGHGEVVDGRLWVLLLQGVHPCADLPGGDLPGCGGLGELHQVVDGGFSEFEGALCQLPFPVHDRQVSVALCGALLHLGAHLGAGALLDLAGLDDGHGLVLGLQGLSVLAAPGAGVNRSHQTLPR